MTDISEVEPDICTFKEVWTQSLMWRVREPSMDPSSTRSTQATRPGHVHYLKAKSAAERERWVHGLRRAAVLAKVV